MKGNWLTSDPNAAKQHDGGKALLLVRGRGGGGAIENSYHNPITLKEDYSVPSM